MYYHNDHWKNPSPVFDRYTPFYCTLREWKSTRTAIPLVGLGRSWLCFLSCCRLLPRAWSATTWTPFLYLTQTFTYMGFVIGTALGYSQFHRRTVRLADILLYADPAATAMDTGHRPEIHRSKSSSPVLADVCYFPMSDFSGTPARGRPFFFVAIMTITFWIISSSGRLHAGAQSELSGCSPAVCHRFAYHSKL